MADNDEPWKEVWLSIEWRGWRIEFTDEHAAATPPGRYVAPNKRLYVSLQPTQGPAFVKRILQWVDEMLRVEEQNATRTVDFGKPTDEEIKHFVDEMRKMPVTKERPWGATGNKGDNRE